MTPTNPKRELSLKAKEARRRNAAKASAAAAAKAAARRGGGKVRVLGNTRPMQLQQLNLPRNFIALVREGRLEEEVARCYAEYRRVLAIYDGFEAQHPEWAERLPWAETRAAWKAAGRPEPQWYEVLALSEAAIGRRSLRASGRVLFEYDWLGLNKAERNRRRSKSHRKWKVKNGTKPVKGYETRSTPWRWK